MATKLDDQPAKIGFNDIPVLLSIQFAANIPVNLVGASGIGKTQTVLEHARNEVREYNRKYETNHSVDCANFYLDLATSEPLDLAGIPQPVTMRVHNSEGVEEEFTATENTTPAWALKAEKIWEKFVHECPNNNDIPHFIVFLDEVNQGTPEMQGAIQKIIQERMLPNNMKLPENVRFVAAMNPASLSMANNNLVSPLANRFAHYHVEPDPDVLFEEINGKSFLNDYGRDISKVSIDIRSKVAQFLKENKEFISKVNKDTQSGCPSLRTWDMFCKVYVEIMNNQKTHFKDSSNPAKDLKRLTNSLLEGLVGVDAAIKIKTTVFNEKFISLNQFLANPKKYRVGENNTNDEYLLVSMITFLENAAKPENMKNMTSKDNEYANSIKDAIPYIFSKNSNNIGRHLFSVYQEKISTALLEFFNSYKNHHPDEDFGNPLMMLADRTAWNVKTDIIESNKYYSNKNKSKG